MLPPQGEGQPQAGHRRIGQAVLPALHSGGGQAVGQGEQPGEEQHALPLGAEGEQLLSALEGDFPAQQAGGQQQGGEGPAAQLERRQTQGLSLSGQGGPGQEGQLHRAQGGGDGQQKGQPHPDALALQPLLILGGQLGGGNVRGQLAGLHHPEPGAAGTRARRRGLLPVHPGGVLLRPQGLRVGGGLVVHVVGEVVRPAQQSMKAGPDGPAHIFRHDLRDGLAGLGRGPFCRGARGLGRGAPLPLRRGGLSLREVYHFFWFFGLWGRPALGAVFRQDLIDGVLRPAFLVFQIGHGILLIGLLSRCACSQCAAALRLKQNPAQYSWPRRAHDGSALPRCRTAS